MIDKTIAGGRYIGTDGRFHDAEGRIIEAEQPISTPVALPDDFPARMALLDAGIVTFEAAQALSNETLLSLKGIGEASLARIRNYGN